MGWDEASAAPIQPSWGEAKATLSAVGVIRAKIKVEIGRSAAGVVELRVIFSPGSGGVSRGDPEASSSGASLGPLSPVNARVLRDLKADHDLDTTVIEGSLAMIRGRYSISIEYGLHVPWSGQRPYSSDALDICILVDALEAGLRFPLHPLIEECLRWWRISPSQVPPNSWRYFVVFLGECQGAGIIPTQDLFMACFRLCKSRGGYYLTARVSFRVSGVPSNNKESEGAHEETQGSAREGESRSHSKGKEPAAPSEEPKTPAEFDERGASPVYHCPRSMKDLFKTKVHKDDAGYYTLQISDLGHQDPDKEMTAKWRGLKNSMKVWNDPSAAKEFERGLLHPQLAREIYTLPSEKELGALKSGGDPEAVAKAEERASELEQELEKTKRERDEVLQRLEASEKELSEVRSNLAEIQRLLKDARVRAQKMDDELLQSVKALENA
ncbi:hypothetical protein BHM03_00011659 [Ensete ventricosum]|nr:hypothetical protein BHM03_00011659 [Ensete ventricosum]